MIGTLSLVYARELSTSRGLAFGFNLLLSLFWIWRFVWQIVYFKREKNKKIRRSASFSSFFSVSWRFPTSSR
ncbi:MAG: hypothetical protein ACOC0U_05290 [Desulfovibrionales bacterium]